MSKILTPRKSRTLYVAGRVPMHTDTFEDFDMPRTYGLMTPEPDQYGGKYCRVYIPNPWSNEEIRYYDWTLDSDGIWRWRSASAFSTRERARDDWRKIAATGRIPCDVTTGILRHDGRPYLGNTWDEWTCHFTGHTQRFYRLISAYGNKYPRKAIANA